MGFVQIIEFRTSRIEEMERVGAEWEAAAGDESKAVRRVLCKDRDNDDRYFNIVFFESYDEAMANSALPATGEFADRMMALADGDATYYNLDVVDDSASS